MEIDLPVHQSAGCKKILDGVDTLFLHHEVVIEHVKHLDDASGTDIPLGNAREEAVATQVVETIHIQLAAYKLMEEALVVFVAVDAYGQTEAP